MTEPEHLNVVDRVGNVHKIEHPAVRRVGPLDLFEISIVSHPPVNGCVALSPEQTWCPRCGVGYLEVKGLGDVGSGIGAWT